LKSEDYESKNGLIFTWWNTSLAPSAISRSSDEDKKYASNVIEFLAKAKGADFIALGEMSESDYDYLINNCKLEGYSYLEKIKDRKSIFDHLPVSGRIERIV
jgi:hypothetical protein